MMAKAMNLTMLLYKGLSVDVVLVEERSNLVSQVAGEYGEGQRLKFGII